MSMTATTMQTHSSGEHSRASASFGNVIAMTDARVARGQAAWSHIKATAEQQREAWRDIGEALLVGRKLHKSNKLFGQWVKDHGFDDMDQRDRSAALWLADNWVAINARCVDKNLSHPRRIREFLMNEPEVKWEEKLPGVQDPVQAELADIQVKTVSTLDLDPDSREAVSLAKKITRSRAGDEGSPLAERAVEAFAKQKGVTVKEVERKVAQAAPATLYQFTPAQVEMLDSIRETALDIANKDGLSLEQVANCFIYIANKILQGEING